ncbi:hypothetical protein AGMMS49975_08930 [Clostridia bacterium]|nr:hypothetical protein AGMMS49975_08930 [Clostridia bacterium]
MAKAKKPVSINGVQFDALIDEERTLEADSPDYPVEDGFSVNDTIILKPQMLSMTLCVTDTPVTWRNKGHGGRGWTDSVIQRLEKLYFNKTPVTIVTSERTYKNMAILSISISKSLEVGYSRQIPISFKEIRVTSSKKTTIPVSYGKSGDTGANAGTASSSAASTPPASTTSSSPPAGSGSGGSQNKASILYNLANSAGLLP